MRKSPGSRSEVVLPRPILTTSMWIVRYEARLAAQPTGEPPSRSWCDREGGTRSTEGGRKVFRVREPAARTQTTCHPTPPITPHRRPEGGRKVGDWYRSCCESGRLRRRSKSQGG